MFDEILDTSTKQISASNFLSSLIGKGGDNLSPTKELSRTQKREIILQEIYSYYLADFDNRKKENWKRYISWLKINRIDEKVLGRTKTYAKFKSKTRRKKGGFIEEATFEGFKFCLKHFPLEDFYVVLSEVKDRSNRGNNVSSFLGGLWFKNV